MLVRCSSQACKTSAGREELHRHKVPRIPSIPLIVLGFLALLMMTDRVPVFRRLDQQSAVLTLLGAVFGLLGALLAFPMAVVAEVLVEELWFWHLEEGSMEDYWHLEEGSMED